MRLIDHDECEGQGCEDCAFEGTVWAPWEIEDESAAEWALAKLTELEVAPSTLQERYEVMRARLEKRAANFRAFIEPKLERYLDEHPPRRGKSLTLLTGSIGRRASKDRVAVEDRDALLAWAGAYMPDAIEETVTRTVPAAAIKSHYTTTGEVPDGCRLIEGGERFFAKGAK